MRWYTYIPNSNETDDCIMVLFNHHLMWSSQMCERVGRCAKEYGQRALFEAIDTWLWREFGIMSRETEGRDEDN